MNPYIRRVLNDDGFLFVLLAASMVGHLALGLITLPDDDTPQLADRQSGRTSVSVQLVSIRKPAVLPTKQPEPDELKVKKPFPEIPKILTREHPTPTTEDLVVAKNDTRRAATETKPQQTAKNESTLPRTRTKQEVAFASAEVEISKANSDKDLTSRQSSGADVPPSFATRTEPRYPRNLLLKGIEGEVLLMVTVGTSGRVAKLAVHKSSGHLSMDDSAVEAVKQWRFIPAKRGSVPIAKRVIVPVRFRIRR